MKVIKVEGYSPEEIEAKIKALGLDGPDVLILKVVLTKPGPSLPVLAEDKDEPGEGQGGGHNVN